MDRFISTVQENRCVWTPAELAAYGLWRLNRVYPFIEGNGRTARASCYYLPCLRSGTLLPGRKILPERIRENRDGYYIALNEADCAWENGHLDFTAMEAYPAPLVQAQLKNQDWMLKLQTIQNPQRNTSVRLSYILMRNLLHADMVVSVSP